MAEYDCFSTYCTTYVYNIYRLSQIKVCVRKIIMARVYERKMFEIQFSTIDSCDERHLFLVSRVAFVRIERINLIEGARVSLFRTSTSSMNHAVSMFQVRLPLLGEAVRFDRPWRSSWFTPHERCRKLFEERLALVRKPRASIYLWSRVAGVYVGPPLRHPKHVFTRGMKLFSSEIYLRP